MRVINIEEELLKLGFVKEEERDIWLLNYKLKIDDDKSLVIIPQLNEKFVWFEEDEMEVHIKGNTIEELIKISKSIVGVE